MLVRVWTGIKSLAGGAAYLGQAGKINEGQVENMRRVDFQVDGLSVDSLVGTGDARRLIFDLALDIGKVVETSIGNVVELCPLGTSRSGGRAETVLCSVGGVLVLGNVDELQDKRATGNNTTASGQEISADNVLQDGRLACGLGADDNLLRSLVSGRKQFDTIFKSKSNIRFAGDRESHCRWC